MMNILLKIYILYYSTTTTVRMHVGKWYATGREDLCQKWTSSSDGGNDELPLCCADVYAESAR